MTEQGQTPEDAEAPTTADDATVEETQAGVAPSAGAIAPTESEAPPPPPPPEVRAPDPVPEPPGPGSPIGSAPPPNLLGDSGPPVTVASERPEIPVAAAFAAGFVLAMILKRLAR